MPGCCSMAGRSWVLATPRPAMATLRVRVGWGSAAVVDGACCMVGSPWEVRPLPPAPSPRQGGGEDERPHPGPLPGGEGVILAHEAAQVVHGLLAVGGDEVPL